MKKVFTLVSVFLMSMSMNAANSAVANDDNNSDTEVVVGPNVPVDDEGTSDGSDFGGFGGDEGFNVDLADEDFGGFGGDEGFEQDGPDEDYGGNDSGSDNYEVDDQEGDLKEGDEGFDQDPLDEDFGGNDSGSDNYEVDDQEGDLTEGDGSEDSDFGGFGGDEGFEQDGPDEDYGGNDSGSDNYEVDDQEGDLKEGDGSEDSDFGGFGGDEGFDQDPLDEDFGGNDSGSDNYEVDDQDQNQTGNDPIDFPGLDGDVIFKTAAKTVAAEEYGGEEFCAFTGKNVELMVYAYNLIIKNWSGNEGYDLVVDFEKGSLIGGMSEDAEAVSLDEGSYTVTNITPLVNGVPVGGPDSSYGGNDSGNDDFGQDGPDDDFGGFGGDEGFNVDPADEDFGGFGGDEGFEQDGPAEGEGDGEGDSDFGGFGGDEGFNVDPADEDFGGFGGDEGFEQDGPDEDFGGNDPDSDNFGVDHDNDIDPEGGDYVGDEGMMVDPETDGWVETTTGDEANPIVRFSAEGSQILVMSETNGMVLLCINCPDADGNYDEDSLPRFYIVEWNLDTTTGVKQVTNVVALEKDVMYNLAGQKVGADYKGVVIKNGKKFLVK